MSWKPFTVTRKPALAASSRSAARFEGLLRLRVGHHRVIFEETADTITIHRVRERRDVYRQL